MMFFSVCLAACQKSEIYGSVQYKAQANIDDSIVVAYMRANNLTGIAKHVQGNDTIGVYYIVIDSGAGTTLFTNSTEVTVSDTTRLITSGLKGNGPLVTETGNFHPAYALTNVLRAWQLGVPEILTGGEVRLLSPSRYAYGHYPQVDLGKNFDLPNGLPANAILDFRIRLYDVTN